jgi:hypothetical protein
MYTFAKKTYSLKIIEFTFIESEDIHTATYFIIRVKLLNIKKPSWYTRRFWSDSDPTTFLIFNQGINTTTNSKSG